MSKTRHDVITVTYDPRKGIPAALLGAMISRLPEDAMIDIIQTTPAGFFGESARTAIGYTYTPERIDK